MGISLRRRVRGFTLVEIAIVLAIVSLLIAAGIGLVAAVLDNARNRATRQNMDGIKLALQSFIARNGRLPCPSVETLGPANAQYGIEDIRTDVPATSCQLTVELPGQAGPPIIDRARRGVVPWKTLGLQAENARDGWGNQITYMVSATATTVTFDTVSGMRGSIYVHSATPPTAGLPATGNQINACSTTANDNRCNRAAVVLLLSHGRNILGAYTPDGVRSPLPTAAAELENTDNDRFVINAEPSATFDDLISPLTPDDFLAPLAAQGAIRNERALFLERARQLLALMVAKSVNDRQGFPPPGPPWIYPLFDPGANPVPPYSMDPSKFNVDCVNPVRGPALMGAPFNLVLDPWGRPFLYARTVEFIEATEACPTPSVLVSTGPNGVLDGDPTVVLASDDLVYYTSLGEWKEILNKAGW